MTRALLYCTFNGIANCTNGIGRQAQTLLGALSRRWDELTALTGPFTPYVAIPEPGPATWAYDPALLTESRQIIEARGGQVIPLRYDAKAEFWSRAVWEQLSQAAASAAADLAGRYDQVGVIAVDTPFAGTGSAFLARPAGPGQGGVTILLALYGTARIHGRPAPDPGRLAWEQASLAATAGPGVRVADIGTFLTSHLAAAYGVPEERFVPWRSSLDLTAPDLQPMAPGQAAAVAEAFGVPAGRPVIAAIGRTDPVKGLDLLIDALGPLRDRAHLVAVVVPFDGHDPLLDAYRRQITARRLSATLVPRFTRDLPRALAALPATRAVACPSRGETLANVPFEVALWARHGGPVVVGPDRDGFREQIAHGRTGILYDPGQPGALTAALAAALDLDPAARTRICEAACRHATAATDVVPNLAAALLRILPGAGTDAKSTT
jgi:glycosyltransferase involved in cell wall biosynthesis